MTLRTMDGSHMSLKLSYAVAAGFLGLIPVGGSLLLLVLEGTMFFHICIKNKVPVLHEGFGLVLTLFAVSSLFKFAAEVLHVVPVIGQFANGIVAFLVVLGLGAVIENYAGGRA
jgi:hypothetical protein